MEIRLNSASVAVEVEVEFEAELGNLKVGLRSTYLAFRTGEEDCMIEWDSG